MKLLVATQRGQGRRDNDFCHTVEGELVYLGMVCGRGRRDPEGECGCGRAFIGLSSHAGTTTVEVRDVPLTREEAIEAVRSSLERGGWISHAAAEQIVDELAEFCDEWPVGTSIERHLDEIRPRPREGLPG